VSGVNLALARRLHELGLNVLPVKLSTKNDWNGLAWKPYQTQRVTDAELIEWFDAAPTNAAIICGSISGVVVVDPDTPEAALWCTTHLPPTPMATQTARGAQLYFRVPANAAKLPAFIGGDLKIELKRDGHYVMAPGSLHPTGHVYAMVKEWPASLDNVPELPLDKLDAKTSTHAAAPLPSVVGSGQRNSTLWTEACRLRRLGWDKDEIFDALKGINRKRCQPPLPDADVRDIANRAAQYTPAADLFPSTEAGDAEFFASVSGDDLRYDHRRSRWLLFNGCRWAPQTDGEVMRLALDAVRARQRAAVGDKARLQWAAKGESRTRLANLLTIAQSLKPIAESGDAWDLSLDLLGVQNGVVDLRTGVLREGRPDDRITLSAGIDFDPAARSQRWEEFLNEVLPHAGLVSYVQRAVGYTATGHTHLDKWWMAQGAGRNGKGVLYGAIQAALGDYAIEVPASLFAVHGSSWDLAKLPGKRLLLSTESGDTIHLNHDLIKKLTGGGSMRAADKYESSFEFVPACKMWLACNNKPKVTDSTLSFWERVVLIPFTVSFLNEKADVALRPLFENDLDHRRAVLAWIVEGAKQFQRDGLGPLPAVVRNAVEAYRLESDPLSPFYEACCVIEPAASVRAALLFARYQRWANDTHVRPESRMSQTAFGRQIKTRFTAEEKRHTTYLGIGIRSELLPEGDI
jgi:putative DNA primase/helicase